MTGVHTHPPGYTLVELVVVMLLLGTIAIACESGLTFGSQVWAHVQSRTAAEDQIVSGQAMTRLLLTHCLPRTEGDYVTFDGEPTSIAFDLIPPQVFEGGTAHAELRFGRSRGGTALELDLQSIADPAFKKHAVLARDTGLLRFSYLDASEGAQTWLSYWRDRNRLPDAIRIAATDSKKWPTLVVRPMIVQSATCLLDPEKLTCRKI